MSTPSVEYVQVDDLNVSPVKLKAEQANLRTKLKPIKDMASKIEVLQNGSGHNTHVPSSNRDSLANESARSLKGGFVLTEVDDEQPSPMVRAHTRSAERLSLVSLSEITELNVRQQSSLAPTVVEEKEEEAEEPSFNISDDKRHN